MVDGEEVEVEAEAEVEEEVETEVEVEAEAEAEVEGEGEAEVVAERRQRLCAGGGLARPRVRQSVESPGRQTPSTSSSCRRLRRRG